MSYAAPRAIADADSHIMETQDWVERHADPGIRGRLHPLALGKAGGATYQLIERAVGKVRARVEAGTPIENVVSGVKGWHAPGAFDPVERSRALDDLGFSRHHALPAPRRRDARRAAACVHEQRKAAAA